MEPRFIKIAGRVAGLTVFAAPLLVTFVACPHVPPDIVVHFAQSPVSPHWHRLALSWELILCWACVAVFLGGIIFDSFPDWVFGWLLAAWFIGLYVLYHTPGHYLLMYIALSTVAFIVALVAGLTAERTDAAEKRAIAAPSDEATGSRD